MGTPIPGTVIAAMVTTGDTANTFAVADQNDIQGGHHSVTTLDERDAITSERRRIGMTCWVSGTVNSMYQLVTGVTNADWVVSQSGTVTVVIEQGTRSDYDQYLQTLIVAETGSRVAGEQAIIAFVFGSIAVDLTNETGSRTASDNYEAGTRSSQDQVLLNLIYDLNGSATGTLAGALAQEILDRAAADSTEAGTRSSQDQNLQNQINSISSSGTGLSAEAGTRSTADQYLQNQITVESSTRLQADQTIVNLVDETYALAAAGTIPPPLSTLPDVNIPAPTANQVLSFDGSRWIAADSGSQSIPAHNALNGLQGGDSGSSQFYHVILDTYSALLGTTGTPANTNRFVTAADLLYQTGTLHGADQTESGTRSSQDQVLLNLINGLSGSSSGTFSSLSAALAQEVLDRTAADSTEAGTRSSQDQVLLNLTNQYNVTEQGTRSTEDQFLQDQITANLENAVNTVSPAQSTLYLIGTASGTASYETLSAAPDTTAEHIKSASVNSSGIVLLNAYISAALDRTSIDGGEWQFDTWATASTAAGTSDIIFEIYLRTVSGAETFLFSGTTAALNTTVALSSIEDIHGSYACNLTDAIVAKYWAQTTRAAATTVSLYYSGVQHYSHFHLPLIVEHNQLAGLQGGSANDYYHLTGAQYVTTVNEAGTRSSQDQALLNLINAEISVRSGATVTEQGTRSTEDQFLQNQITANASTIITEQGTRSTEDQFLQNQVSTNQVNIAAQTTWFGTTYGLPSGGTTGQVLKKSSASNYDANWSELLSIGTVATTTGTISLDFNGATFQTETLTGDPFFITTNAQSGKFISVRLLPNGSTRALNFGAPWSWLGTAYSSATLSIGKVAILSLTAYGPNETDVIAVYAAQP